MNVIIAECPSSGGVCQPLPVVGIGKFFLQKHVQLSGNPSTRGLFGEFGGLVDPSSLQQEIRLFR